MRKNISECVKLKNYIKWVKNGFSPAAILDFQNFLILLLFSVHLCIIYQISLNLGQGIHF